MSDINQEKLKTKIEALKNIKKIKYAEYQMAIRELINAKLSCPHKETYFVADPSGNGDSYRVCVLCKTEIY